MKQKLNNYTIVELKIFIDALDGVIKSTPSDTPMYIKVKSAKLIANELLFTKIQNFIA
jgi:hypothetical protein